MARRIEDLIVWQLSRQVKLAVSALTDRPHVAKGSRFTVNRFETQRVRPYAELRKASADSRCDFLAKAQHGVSRMRTEGTAFFLWDENNAWPFATVSLAVASVLKRLVTRSQLHEMRPAKISNTERHGCERRARRVSGLQNSDYVRPGDYERLVRFEVAHEYGAILLRDHRREQINRR